MWSNPTLLILLLLDKSLGYQSDHKNHETLIVNHKKCALQGINCLVILYNTKLCEYACVCSTLLLFLATSIEGNQSRSRVERKCGVTAAGMYIPILY